MRNTVLTIVDLSQSHEKMRKDPHHSWILPIITTWNLIKKKVRSAITSIPESSSPLAAAPPPRPTMIRLAELLCLTILVAKSAAFQIATLLPLPRQQQQQRPTSSWTPTALASSSSPDFAKTTVISPDDSDFQFDTGLGGVRLAQESAIKLTGTVKKKGSDFKVGFQKLIRYTVVKEVADSKVQDQLQKVGAKIVCTGRGEELHMDPGTTTEKTIVLGPLDAAEDALKGVTAASDADEVVINVLGGDDLQFLEVKDALEMLVPKLDCGKANVRFNSLCHSSFPLGSVTITAVALPEDTSSNGLSGAEKAVADGEVYFRDSKWWTVNEEDINTAVA